MLRKGKAVLRYLCVCLLRGTGLLWWAKRRAAKNGVVVLTLHRVLDDSEFFQSSSLPGILVRESTFQQFVLWAGKQLEILDLAKGSPAWDIQCARPRAALTFDDGWVDNYEFAAPILVRNHAPATIFICPDLMGKPFPFWPERVSRLITGIPHPSLIREVFPELPPCSSAELAGRLIESLKQMEPKFREERISCLEKISSGNSARFSREPFNRTMSWEQIQELHSRGIQIGSHTSTHPILTSIPEDQVRVELACSRRKIESRLRLPCRTLAYPNGDHDETAVQAARDAGYTRAFTTKRGLWTKHSSSLRIPRINISEQKLTGPFGRFSPAMAEYSLFWNLMQQ